MFWFVSFIKSNILSSVPELMPCCSGELKGNVSGSPAGCPDEWGRRIIRKVSKASKGLTDGIKTILMLQKNLNAFSHCLHEIVRLNEFMFLNRLQPDDLVSSTCNECRNDRKPQIFTQFYFV